MQLHSFFNSSTSYRVRIALALKGLPYDYLPVDIRAGAHRAADYVAGVNASASVPAIVDGGFHLGQSMAIIDWLDQVHPEPRLIPLETQARARVLELSNVIACDIHPVNNLRVLTSLRALFGAGDQDVANWFRHWVNEGFQPLEKILATSPQTGRFCHGDVPGLADICLAAQVTNNARFGVDMASYPVISRIHAACMELPAFQKAAPQNQIDAE